MSVASTLVSLGSQQKSSTIASHTNTSDPFKHDSKSRRNSRPVGVVKPLQQQQQQQNTPSHAEPQQPPLHNTTPQPPLHTSPPHSPLHTSPPHSPPHNKKPNKNVSNNIKESPTTVDVACGTDNIISRNRENNFSLSSTNSSSNSNNTTSSNNITKVSNCNENSISNTTNAPESTASFTTAPKDDISSIGDLGRNSIDESHLGRNSIDESHSNGDIQKRSNDDRAECTSVTSTRPPKVSANGAQIATCI